MLKKILPVLVLALTIGCQQQKNEWNPIFENTGFDYLNTNVERSLLLIDEATSAAVEETDASVQEKLTQARKKLLEIKDYYIPLTTIRQKVYDAERHYKLNQIAISEKLLKSARDIMTSLDSLTRSDVFNKVIVDLDRMFEEVITSLDDDTEEKVYTKMKALGEHINLMLEKGELVLSGIEFDK